MQPIVQTCSIYFAWIIIHYTAAHLYVYYCVPDTISGFLLSPLYTPMPHCSLLRWGIYQGGETIALMWLILSMLIVKMLTPHNAP